MSVSANIFIGIITFSDTIIVKLYLSDSSKGSLLVKRNTHKCSFFQEILATLLLIIAVCHSPLEIKIMTIREVATAPVSTKEPGGTRIVTNRISMVYIVVAITPPAVME